MTVAELIAAAKASVVDDAKIADLQARVSAADRRYEEQADGRAVDGDTLARTYSL